MVDVCGVCRVNWTFEMAKMVLAVVVFVMGQFQLVWPTTSVRQIQWRLWIIIFCVFFSLFLCLLLRNHRFGSKTDEQNGERRSTQRRDPADQHTMLIHNRVRANRYHQMNSKQKKSKLILSQPHSFD